MRSFLTDSTDEVTLSGITVLRRDLHNYPELSGMESTTSDRVRAYINSHYPGELLNELGGHGVAMKYDYPEQGKVVVIRCEMDALPIQEYNDTYYRSANPGVSHKCGHDGHMAMVAGLLPELKRLPCRRGSVILLFQPAEETGTGARMVLEDSRFDQWAPDYIFALHNIPGEIQHGILIINDHFSATVQSMAIRFTGIEAHAAEPQEGISPAPAISGILEQFDGFNVLDPGRSDFTVITPVFIRMGNTSYGISPAQGELHVTMRTWSEGSMELLKSDLERVVSTTCRGLGLEFSIEWMEFFPAAINDRNANEIVRKVAEDKGFPVILRAYPFKFGEDFGWYSRKYRTAMFGLGAGTDIPPLHHPDYDFPDAILKTGIEMFLGIIQEVLNS